jgi:hypothetical protein
VVGGLWLVERRHPPALATLRFSVSPPLRLPRLPNSSSLPSIDSSAPPTTRPLPHATSTNTSPAPPTPSVPPVPHPLFLSFSLWRRDVGTCVSALVNASTPPRRPASPSPRISGSPYLRLPVSPAPRPAVPSPHRFISTPTTRPLPHATSTNTSPAIPNDSVSPSPRFPNSSPPRLIGTLSNEAASPSTAPRPASPSTQYPIPNTQYRICAKSPERYRAPAHRWWGRAGGMIV